MAKKKMTAADKALAIELAKNDFRVAIFGSARINKNDKVYKEVFKLAQHCGEQGFDIVTGGGPGLMEAANAGHEAGDKKHQSDNIGLTIYLPWETKKNKHLEIKKHFNKFSGRLDHFMALSSVMVVMEGGVGTCLELFYSWQLVQVKHVNFTPIILVGKMWKELIKWVKKYPLKLGLVSPKDLDCIFVAKNTEQALKIIMDQYSQFKKGKKKNNSKYL